MEELQESSIETNGTDSANRALSAEGRRRCRPLSSPGLAREVRSRRGLHVQPVPCPVSWFTTAMRKPKPASESVRDGWHEACVDVPMSDVRPLRVVAAFLAVWAWTAGILILGATVTRGLSAATYAVASLAYLALFGIPVAYAMYKMEKRSLAAYIVAALATSVPMALFSLSLGSPVGACIVAAIAAVGALIAYGIVERL